MNKLSRNLAVIGLFVSASLLSFSSTITQAPAPSGSGTIVQHLEVPPDLAAFHETSKAYDPINKPETLSPMYDAVMSKNHVHIIDPTAAKLMKPVLSSYEKAYWQGKHPGIDEADIVNLVNTFADTYKLPEIAKTTQSQVHYLRMRATLFGLPYFMSKGVRLRKSVETGELTTASTKMSPLQAFLLVQTLMDRKIVEEKFQVTPADWEAHYRDKTDSAPKRQVLHQYPAAGRALSDSLRHAFNTMTTADAVSFVSKSISGVNNSQ